MPCGNDDPRLPGDAKRIVMPSRGVEYDLVNSEVSYADGGMTGAAAAEVLRSLRRGRVKFPIIPAETGISSIFPTRPPLAAQTIKQIKLLPANSRSAANREFAPDQTGITVAEPGTISSHNDRTPNEK
jgi:hypothetical protein